MPTLCKQERLFEKRLLSMLFDKGKRFTCANSLRVCYLLVPRSAVWNQNDFCSGYSCKLLVSAPKSRYKRAVDRNRIKRLLREVFRLNKELFAGLVPAENVLLISLQFVGENPSFDLMWQLVEKTAQTLQNRFNHA